MTKSQTAHTGFQWESRRNRESQTLVFNALAIAADVQAQPRAGARGPGVDRVDPRQEVPGWRAHRGRPQGRQRALRAHEQDPSRLDQQDQHVRQRLQAHGEHQQVSANFHFEQESIFFFFFIFKENVALEIHTFIDEEFERSGS